MLDKRYNFKEKEPEIYKYWESNQSFTPKIDKTKEPFTIIMPPPNSNGSLHIGHAMFVTLQDIMIRYNRMKGKSALWIPGADHAGILTQVVFERTLAKKKLSRYKLGREEFFKQCFEFTQSNKATMYGQIKTLGASADWSREKFTLDPNISKQVVKTFIQLYQDNLVYRDERLVNWCPRCMTALSNLEVEHHKVDSKIWYIMYPLTQKASNTGQTRFIIVATTRPETMLGDTAVAVHPEDKRYHQFIGETVTLPIINREIPIIADSAVDPEFGTGAVKVTPAHDPADFDMGQRNNLESIQVIDYNNKMTAAAGEQYAGMKVKEARQKILSNLRKLDILVKTKNYSHEVGHCERCKTIIEPQISQQWFIKMKPLAEKAKKAVEKGETEIIPKRFTKDYNTWLENIHDWCISRQLWWGHQLPIYYCGTKGLSELQKKMNPDLIASNQDNKGCGHIFVSEEVPTKCPKCKNKNIIQDPDTFDTWFSSGQWPYTTLGYPDSEDYKYFYPTSVMETGYEIIFFWVARMMMLGIYRTGQVPFKKVYLHGLVRDAFGQKMSKSKGNVINPLDVIEKYGADALRMALIVGATPGNDISIGEPKIKGYRNFANKLWNIARFIEMNMEGKEVPWYNAGHSGAEQSEATESSTPKLKLNKEDKEMINKLNKLITSTTEYLDKSKFSLAGEQLYDFVWNDLANTYIEESKEKIKGGDTTTLSVLKHVFINSLKLLHPYVPFVTEAIWQQFPHKYDGDLITSNWPKA